MFITFQLLEPPLNISINPENQNGQIAVVEGSNIALECSVNDGKPSVTLYWTTGENIVYQRNKTEKIKYTLTASRQFHKRYFTCIANNTFYQIKRTTQIHLYLKPLVKIYAIPKLIEEGRKLVLVCENQTNVKPTDVTWFYDDSILLGLSTFQVTFPNVSRNKAGKYTCRVTNIAGIGTKDFHLIVNYKPYVTDGIQEYVFDAELYEPTYISISILSSPRPDVAWSQTAHGKLGSWNCQLKDNESYIISSNIVPEINSHVGEYGIVVRNYLGSLNIIVKLESSTVKITPLFAHCNMSSHLHLECQISESKLVQQLHANWIHEINGTTLRILSGQQSGNTSVLTIKYCDYREMGDYVCKWKSVTREYSNTARVTVFGHPIIAIKEVVPNNETSIQLVVQFLSVPNPTEVRWFLDDSIISKTDTRFKREIHASLIQQEIHSKKVILPGFKTYLVAALHFRNTGLTFSCQIRNMFGTRYVSFEGDLFKDVHETFEDNEHHNEEGLDVLDAMNNSPIQHHTSNEEVNSSESRNSDGNYEEIENEIYHDAEWRNSETESSSSEATQHNDYENTDICNDYEDLDETKVEVHSYEI
ncbi:HMCN [Mytilus coruscus]|uniref:HMCN n=1 Tax=Mytilus coruscus TaxID=42192 RepID=A0A6J7ZXX8_MYTCO|nr:HMCN [Mytilus coruscus]